MENNVKSREEDADDSSSLSRLPDEIILQILNKVIDLKFLCFCYLVSKRFSSIVLQIDAISFTVPFVNPSITDKNTVDDVDGGGFPRKLLMLLKKPLHLVRGMIVGPSRPVPPVVSSFGSESLQSAMAFQSKFSQVKSLSIELAFSSLSPIDNAFLFKWKARCGWTIDAFIFLSPNSICDSDGNYLHGEEGVGLTDDLLIQKTEIAARCHEDMARAHAMMSDIVKRSPKLEEVSVIDSGRRGRLSLNGEKLGEAKKLWYRSPKFRMDDAEMLSYCGIPIMSNYYIPVLNLPVSGYVMKGVYVLLWEMSALHGGNATFINSEDGFEDKQESEYKQEAAYTEAVMDILEKHKGGRLQRLFY